MSLPPTGSEISHEIEQTTTLSGPPKGKQPLRTGEHIPDTCVICLSSITERAVTYPCNHLVFDFLCLVSWLQQRPNCPLCNTPVQRVEYDWRSPHDFKTYHVPRPPLSPSQPSPSHPRRNHNLRPRGRFPRAPHSAPTIPSSSTLSLDRRKLIYARHLFSLHRAPSRPVEALTPTRFRSSSILQRKARLFLRRELQIFTFLQTTARIEFVLEYIVGMLRKLELKGADGAMENLVAEVLGREGARLLLHELGAWLESSFERLEEWDRVVQYADAEIMRMGTGRGGAAGRQERKDGARV
ncbi:Zinc finger C3HC4 type domain-containing protein [Elsinoe fawcettii]|nr:Zinc finger C3HC4 type domain-containing protein [Elsinoe fawcettii]